MDYKKLYDKALELTRQKYEQARKDNNPIYCIYEEIFPELRESEDERIRKWLIDLVKRESGFNGTFPSQGQILAYLEKQKEQKHAPDDLQKSFEAGQTSIVDNPEQYGLCKKTEWGEEDEKMRRLLIAIME